MQSNRPSDRRRASTPSSQTLSPAWRELLALFQRLSFGRIEHLVVRGGEPVIDPPPRPIHEVKFGGENGPRQEAGLVEFTLKAQHLDLIQRVRDLGDGVVTKLTFKHGLPFSAEFGG